jgi:hypothetical protein
MALEMKWSEGEYTTGDQKSDMGAIVVHLWNGRYHQGFVAKIGRKSWGHHSKWEVLGHYQTLYAAQVAVEKHMTWRRG